MAGVDDKITNGLFVWGRGEDIVTGLPTQGSFIIGAEAGDMVYADFINTPLRVGTLVSYSLIEALKLGPGTDIVLTNDLSGNWYDGLSPVDFDYSDVINSTTLTNFYTNLSTVVRQYLKYAQVYHAVQANVWRTARNFTIASNDGTGGETTTGIDGSGNVILKLPATIKANLTGTASEATHAANATNAENATEANHAQGASRLNDGVGNIVEGDRYHPVYFTAGGTPNTCDYQLAYNKTYQSLTIAKASQSGGAYNEQNYSTNVNQSVKVECLTNVEAFPSDVGQDDSYKFILINTSFKIGNNNDFITDTWYRIDLTSMKKNLIKSSAPTAGMKLVNAVFTLGSTGSMVTDAGQQNQEPRIYTFFTKDLNFRGSDGPYVYFYFKDFDNYSQNIPKAGSVNITIYCRIGYSGI